MTGRLYEYGVTAATDSSVILTPSTWKGSGADTSVPGIIYCHGAGGYVGSIYGAGGLPEDHTLTGEAPIIHELSKHWPVIVSDLDGPQTWGVSAAVAAVETARTHLQSVTGCKSGPVMLAGTSMGHVTMIQYANAHQANVAGVAGFIPVSSVNDIYVNNRLSLRSAIGTAWGVTYPTALPSGALIENLAAGLNGLPWKVWYSSGDTVVIPATVAAFAAAIGGTAVIDCALDHSQASVAAAPISDVVKWVFTCLGAWHV